MVVAVYSKTLRFHSVYMCNNLSTSNYHPLEASNKELFEGQLIQHSSVVPSIKCAIQLPVSLGDQINSQGCIYDRLHSLTSGPIMLSATGRRLERNCRSMSKSLSTWVICWSKFLALYLFTNQLL